MAVALDRPLRYDDVSPVAKEYFELNSGIGMVLYALCLLHIASRWAS